ncbi:MAG: hypothetical protein CMP18_01055 [Rickettsiales bacterium]|nr:hypothetical protein [Rickettsiales bacterium]
MFLRVIKHKLLKLYRLLLIIFLSFFFAGKLFAKQVFIRDAEIEEFLRDVTIPIAKAADLNYNNIKIFIIKDSNINAFVSGGQNIFINTGLITKFKKPGAIIGVIAHEIGHIKAGHLARHEEGYEISKSAILLSYFLGAGAIAAGSYDAGSAIMMGGTHIANRMSLKYSRSQEEVADQYAIKFLNKISYSADGLIELLEYFNKKYNIYSDFIDPYSLTHPISSNRIDLIINSDSYNLNNNNYSNNIVSQDRMDTIKAKIIAFEKDPRELILEYKKFNDPLSRYILSIAYHRSNNHKKSINIISKLIANYKNDKISNLKFLYELRAQFLFENGYINESINDYEKAISLMPLRQSILARIAYSNCVIISGVKLKKSLKYLNESLIIEPNNAIIYKNIAAINYKLGNKILSQISLAKYYYYIDKIDKAKSIINELENQINKSEHKTEIDDLIDLFN